MLHRDTEVWATPMLCNTNDMNDINPDGICTTTGSFTTRATRRSEDTDNSTLGITVKSIAERTIRSADKTSEEHTDRNIDKNIDRNIDKNIEESTDANIVRITVTILAVSEKGTVSHDGTAHNKVPSLDKTVLLQLETSLVNGCRVLAYCAEDL
jgi:hypothetical protein